MKFASWIRQRRQLNHFYMKRLVQRGQTVANEKNDTAKAILFTKKKTTSASLRCLATTLKGRMKIAQVPDSYPIDEFRLSSYPSLIVLPGSNQPAQSFTGKYTFPEMAKFLESFVSRDETRDEDTANKPEEPSNSIKTITSQTFSTSCIDKSGTCIVVFDETLDVLFQKLSRKPGSKFLKFYQADPKLKDELSASMELSDSAAIAVNAQKNWFSAVRSDASVESWLTDLRMGDTSVKTTIPDTFVSRFAKHDEL